MAEVYAPRTFTPEQESRLREIIREEIVEDHVRHSGFTGELADGYRASLLTELNAPIASEAPRG